MAGYILAGGHSSRMGVDKATLEWADGRVIDAVVAALLDVTDTVTLVVDTADRAYQSLNAAYLVDAYSNCGPLGGLVTALLSAEQGYHIVVSCDCPRLNPRLLSLLLNSTGGADALVPMVDNRLQPLCAVYHTRCAEPLRNCLIEGERAVHRALKSVGTVTLSDEELRAVDPNLESFMNLNTTEEYNTARRNPHAHTAKG